MKNHAVSVRARLLNRARADRTDFQRLLVRFAIERLLYRLSVSEHADDFVLKGSPPRDKGPRSARARLP